MAATKKPKVKSPFDLHPAVRARSNLATAQAREVALSPDGALALVADGFKAAVYDTLTGERALVDAALEGSPAQYVAWSPRGDRVATLRHHDGRDYVLTLWDAATGAAAHTVNVDGFSVVFHGAPGSVSPSMVFDAAGEALYVRSTNISPRGASVWRVEVATGASTEWSVPCDSLLEAILPLGDELLMLFHGGPGEGVSAWRFGASAPHASVDGPRGLCFAEAGGRLWVMGDGRWGSVVDLSKPRDAEVTTPRATDAEEAARAARIEALAARASGDWYVRHMQWEAKANADARAHEARVSRSGTSSTSRAFLRVEPYATPQCAALGRGVLTRDGVSLVAYRLDGDAVVETRLVEDLKKCAPNGARMQSISVAGNVVAVVWNKSLGGGTALVSVLDVDLATAGLA